MRCPTIVILVLSTIVLSVKNQSAAASSFSSTNPYYRGCLYEYSQRQNTTASGEDTKMLSSSYRPRVCNSNDPPEAMQQGACRQPDFETYLEIRIATGNWDSATMLAWLTQLVLSEIAGIPSTIESGMYGSSRDFYDINGAIDYDTGLGPDALMTAADLPDSDCTQVPDLEGEAYIPCAHFYPEFWGEPASAIKEMKVEPSQATGFLGYETWFVTKFTAHEFPQFVSYHGLEQQENRELLAQTFKRPTAWRQYCEEVSMSNCSTPDEVAIRAPETEEEANRMFASADGSLFSLLETPIYTGHFRYTEKNNCTLWPSNCTGHIANYPCGWSSNMESQLYYYNIPLDANNGPNGGPNGYTESQLKEMWHAANYTKSHLMMQWWSPEPLYQHYLGTDAEMQQVTRRPYTRECAYAREEWKDECAEDFDTRVGAPEEACGDSVEPLRKLINVGLKEALDSPDIPEEARSPAYDILRFFAITEIQLGELFDAWESAVSPRDAVCQWAVDNLEQHLLQMIPPSYPRIVQENKQYSSYGIVSMVLGGLACLVVFVTAFLVYRKRNEPSIQYAQIDFLAILLVGSFFIAMGSILLSAPASSATCISSLWFVNLGYTLELVPLILKVAAINRLMSAARVMRRIRVKRTVLYRTVASISLGVVFYLALWTGLSPPEAAVEYTMTDTVTSLTEVIVGKTLFCSDGGDTSTWQFVAVAWNLVLLVCASVLAFQARNVVQSFNESRTLAMMIYSHFIFILARICIIYLGDRVGGSTANYSLSLVYAVDQITACCIYFLPKIIAMKDPEMNSSNFSSGDSPSYLQTSRRNVTSMLGRIKTATAIDLSKRCNSKDVASSDRFSAGSPTSGNGSASVHMDEAVTSSETGETKKQDAGCQTDVENVPEVENELTKRDRDDAIVNA